MVCFAGTFHQVFNSVWWNANACLLTDKSLNKFKCSDSWFCWMVNHDGLVDTSLLRGSQAGFVRSESISSYVVKDSLLSSFQFPLYFIVSGITKNILNSPYHQCIEVFVASLYPLPVGLWPTWCYVNPGWHN